MPDLQAARGASLITSETAADTAPVPPRRRWLLVLVIAGLGLAVDQTAKQLSIRWLTGEPPVPLLGDVLQLRLLYNPGAAFSIGTSVTPLITVVAIVAAVAIAWYAGKVRHAGWAVALGLLMAGVLGNLTDRLVRQPGPFRGHVVDMLMLPNWPVFNVADIWINSAAVLLVVLTLTGRRLDGSREHDEEGATT